MSKKNSEDLNEPIETISNITLKNEDQWAKIAITKEADRALFDLLNRIQDGFNAGKATKQEVASLIVLKFFKDHNDNDIQEIRARFFDPILMMEAELRKAKETGLLSDSIKEFFQSQFLNHFSAQAQSKKSKKSLNQNIIKDNTLLQEESA